MSMISESSDRIAPSGSVDSPPSADEACDGVGAYLGVSFQLKKGPWTSAEDAILVEYVTEHGEGNWNAVQRHSGLARCGKSCRLRWANHLRPNLKKGAFTPEEERRIIELHAKIGNKWARMAAELPGRTDNEIKNYWNTRIKRQQRAGVPIYPVGISSQALTESKNGNMSAYSDENPEIMPMNGFGLDIPTVEFKSSHLYSSSPLDIPTHNFHEMLINNSMLVSHNNDTLLSAVYPTKRLRQSESFFPSFDDGFSYHHVLADDVQPFEVLSECDENPTDVLPVYSHVNGTYSSSEPIWAKKMELPSLQTPMGTWDSSSSSPLPSLESPPTESGCLSPRNSGLLDAVLHESKYLNTRVEPVDESIPGHHEAELEAFNDLNYSSVLPMLSSNYMFPDESSFI